MGARQARFYPLRVPRWRLARPRERIAMLAALALAAVTFIGASAPPGAVARAIALRLRVDGLGRLQDVALALPSGDAVSDRAAVTYAKDEAFPSTARDWTAAGREYLQIIHVAPWSGELDAGPLIDYADHGVVLVRDGYLAMSDEALRAHAAGSVTVRVIVEASGRISSAAVVSSSGSPDLDDAALSSAREALYLPATSNGETVRASYTATYRFDVHVIQAV